MIKLITTIFLLVLFASANGQDFSNRGKDFWVGYGYHQTMNSSATLNNQDMVLYLSADVNSTVTVEIPGIAWTKTYTVPGGTVKISDNIPKSGLQDARLLQEGIFNKGIHITSNQPIVAYAHIFDKNVSGASLLFPVNTLGQDYYALSYEQKSGQPNSNSWAFVVATEDSTTVEITPSASTLTHPAAIPFVVTLNRGQIYNLMGKLNTSNNNGVDLTGTRIRSISNGLISCKKIAVFSGSGRMSISCNGSWNSSDNFIQQAFPRAAWGKKYLTIPTVGLTNNFFRVAVSDPTTIVSVDGTVITGLQRNFFYEFSANNPKSIVADKPVIVAQYITTTNGSGSPATCGNSYSNNGDPEMIYLSPVEQTIDTITLFSTPKYNITEHHINVVIKTSDKNSFTLDGVTKAASFIIHPKDTAYSYAAFTVAAGQHKLQAAGGFNAIAYGYGQFESYGYNAGTNIKDLYTFISLQNQFDIVNTPSTCINTNFLLALTLPYQPSSITWDFSGAAGSLSPSGNVINNSPVADSTFIRDGKTLYVYKIPGSYVFTTAGTFPIKIITVNPTADGCSGQNETVFNMQVGLPPTVDFSISHIGCYNTPASFYDSTKGNGFPIVKWQWNFGDLATDTLQNPVHTYAASGNYNVKLTAVNSIGCSNSAIKPFSIEPQPIAGFKVSSPLCAGTAVTFTDSSNIVSGTIKIWRWAFGPGDSVINTTNASVTKIYSTAGTYTVTLVVENSSGCKSTIFSKTFTVNALPFVNFNMPGVCLPAGNAQFTNLSTIAGGTVNDMSYVWNFGDGGSSTLVNPAHIYASAGPFLVKLSAKSSAGCTHDSAIKFTNIYSQPKAGFTYSPPNTCTGDSLTFFDTTKAPGSTVTNWYWTFSDGTTSNIKNPGKKFTTVNASAKLYIKTAAGCFSDTATRNITFYQLPTALFNITGTTCQGQTFNLNNQSVANSGILTNWYWYFGNGTSASYTNGNSFTRKYDTSGSYTIKLVVKNDKGCVSDTAKIKVNIISAPTVKFGLPFICVNDPFGVFTDSSSITGGGTLSHLWNFGDINATPTNPNTSLAVNGQHHFGTAGPYNITLQVGTTTGCTSSLTKQLIVNSQAVAGFSILNTGSICGSDSVKIKNTSTIGVGLVTRLEIIWDSVNHPLVKEADTLPPSGKTYSHIYPSSASNVTYKITVRAFSGQTCMDEKTQQVTIGVTPKVVFDSIGEFCLNDPARLLTEAKEILGVSGSGIYSGLGVTANGIFNPVTAGAGNIHITYAYTSANGCKDSASQNINVVANPVIQLSNQLYVLEGGILTLNPIVSGNAIKYSWTPATYLSNANSLYPISKPKGNISYQFIASTAGGCSDSAIANIVVLNAPRIPNAFSPNGDGKNDLWDITSLSSYPGSTVEVFNRYGQAIFISIGYSKPWDGTYKGSPLPEGVYYYIIDPKNGRNKFTGNVTIIR